MPRLIEDIIDAGEDIRLTSRDEDHERILARRFGLARHEVASMLFAALCGYRRAYRSLKFSAQSSIQMAERLRVQTMEEVA